MTYSAGHAAPFSHLMIIAYPRGLVCSTFEQPTNKLDGFSRVIVTVFSSIVIFFNPQIYKILLIILKNSSVLIKKGRIEDQITSFKPLIFTLNAQNAPVF